MAGPKLPRRYFAFLAAALLLFSPAVAAVERGRNRSSLLEQPSQWATGKDEAENLRYSRKRKLAAEAEGGGESTSGDRGSKFSLLDSMLQWAIGDEFYAFVVA